MKEINDIIEEFDRIGSGSKAAMATVVRVEGSSYRQPGARMLISDEGKLTGAISGGCLEGDALRKALLVIARGKPMLVTYDTTVDDDSGLGIGLGCNGIIHILIEPIDRNNPTNPIALLKTISNSRQKAVLLTLFSMHNRYDGRAGTFFAFTENLVLHGSTHMKMTGKQFQSVAQETFERRQSLLSDFATEDGEGSVFADYINPVISLIIVGAGNDVQPLVKITALLGWKTTVIDGRPSHATCQRFPDASKVFVADAGQALSQITVDDHTAVVLMTHNYYYDIVMFERLLHEKVFYIGVLGPKKKLQRMLQELSSENKIKTDNVLQNVFGPVGLDIGAETAEEIAISIIAEIKAVLSGSSGTPLHFKADPIHKRNHEEGIPAGDSVLTFQH